MPVRGMSNTAVVYNTLVTTPYANQADLQSTIGQLEVTNLASTAKEFITEPAEWTIRMGGFFDMAVDNIFGVDAVSPGTKRSASIAFTEGGQTVTYLWTLQAEIANYQIQSTPTGVITWSAELRLSGAPTSRTVA
jgi:hypothetical protein